MKTQNKQKTRLHPRSKHRQRYNLEALTEANPLLEPYVMVNDYGDQTIDFFDNRAIIELNKAILFYHYPIVFWEFPTANLCPPIPSRADYIHHIADLLAIHNSGTIPRNIQVIDIGTGATCIYPILGHAIYGWQFVASDINHDSLRSAQTILTNNPNLKDKIDLRHQPDASAIFNGIIAPEETFELCICNPPFHSSLQEAQKGSLRKIRNLKKKKVAKAQRNFGGNAQELWCEGGEKQFILRMIEESKQYARQIRWFSTLVSKESHVHTIKAALRHAQVKNTETISMGQGNKTSRIIAWTFG